MARKANYIGVSFGKFTLILKNTREVYGHDDSLPFNTEYEILNEHNIVVLNGTSWNDGWGGECVIDFRDNEENNKIYNEANEACLKAFTHETSGCGRTFKLDVDLPFLMDTMACLTIDCPSTRGKIYAEEALLAFFKSH